jgi:hypothetical protein
MEIITLGFFNFLLTWVLFNQLQFVNDHFIKSSFIERLCSKCFSFWLTLAITWNIFAAALAAFIFHLYEKFINTDVKI